ncbi:BsuBI/PstI family type II restriction endonuclease [Catenulispora pinisilvae]|uniref:BsuBI/PstI family type II restriction endonuclease n=1 Tax=Catenulispora pinisilvae TaxID=2705253 RepID=UPI002B26DFA3|nr:BsuBI/PstI family type II restriction endonuclease [Catenulispora pinisilvae]
MTNSTDPGQLLDNLLGGIEQRRLEVAGRRPSAVQRKWGQFFTPRAVAEQIAAHPRLDQDGELSILDPGAGVGVLVAAVIARALRERPGLPIRVTALEIDPSLNLALEETLTECRAAAAELGTELLYEVVAGDFIDWGMSQTQVSLDAAENPRRYDIVVQNPPYGKVQRTSAVRGSLSMLGVEVPNIYAAFLAIATRVLAPGGQLVAITPRSFCNGVYFRSFRADLLAQVGLDRISVFHERDTLFSDSSVLQETIIFSATQGIHPDNVMVVTARGYLDPRLERLIPYTDLVVPSDPEAFLRIPTDADDDAVSATAAALPATLADLGLKVSTGRVVDFRATGFLRMDPEPGAVPLIYPHHFNRGSIAWPVRHAKKANAIVRASETEKQLFPAGTYVVVKRLSSKEEKRRIVSVVYDPDVVESDAIGFENHVNVIHADGIGLDPVLARGMSVWLNSNQLDSHFRQFSGHTQVNATDLRNMRYPDRPSLTALGEAVTLSAWPEQGEIDALVRHHVLVGERDEENQVIEDDGTILNQARRLLLDMKLDAERSNERSALVLLTLARLGPDDDWSQATNPMLRTVQIMDYLRQHHGRDYKPNTRETIRRQTLHQFIDAGLVVLNPDDPGRPVNSPHNCYQLTDRATELIRLYGTTDFEPSLKVYLADLPGLKEVYFAERKMHRIKLTLPDGGEVDISGGGQNELIEKMVEEFCPRYTPGGVVLYVGDADDKWKHSQNEALAALGVTFDSHGKMPDLVVHLKEKNWLVLMEAVTSHGPVDAKRHKELKTLFADSTAGLVFVSCFETRADMRQYLKDIAWETEVWCADSPTHMVHFNGSRFLGPYGPEAEGEGVDA